MDVSIKHILVTGGAGYVGAVLIPKLLKQGYQVTVVDLYMYGRDIFLSHRCPALKEVVGDIRDTELMDTALKGIDAVIHLACISNDPSFELNPDLGKSINYDATIQLVDLSKKHNIKRFIYASSSSVYGVKADPEVTEDLPLEPLTDYSKFKAMCEPYVIDTLKDSTALVLRPATVCGYSPRLRLDLTVNILTISALTKKKITVFGGNQKRPNIHIEDMTDLYVKALEYPHQQIHGKIFNAGYDNLTVMEIAQMVKKVIGDETIEIEVQPSSDNRSYHVSSKKIFEELGYKATHTVEDAIRDIVEAYNAGKITDPSDRKYYNIKTMQALGMK